MATTIRINSEIFSSSFFPVQTFRITNQYFFGGAGGLKDPSGWVVVGVYTYFTVYVVVEKTALLLVI